MDTLVPFISELSGIIFVLNTCSVAFANGCLLLSRSLDVSNYVESGLQEELVHSAEFLHTRKIQEREQCTPEVELHRCNTKFENDPKWTWRRDYTYAINGIVKKGCETSALKYRWTVQDYKTGKYIKDFPQFENKPIFVLDYFALDTGNYTLTVSVTEADKGKVSGSNSAKCLITIRPEIPIAVILGGNSRTVPSKTSFRVEGNNSRNMDVKPGGLALLNFRWSCEAQPKNTFCSDNHVSFVNHITVPASYSVTDATFKFILEVSTDYSDWVSTEQTVFVKDEAYKVFISCLKNCGKKINYRSVIFLQVNCEDCPKQKYDWSMKPGPNNQKQSIDFGTETAFGKNDSKLIIKENVLVPGDQYTFTATYDGGNSITSLLLAVTPLPPTGKCAIVPTEGKSLTTVFNITCNDAKHADPLVYKLFQSNSDPKEPGTLLGANEEGQFSLLLPTGKSNSVGLEIQISDVDGLYSIQQLRVTVNPLIPDLPANQQIGKIIDAYRGKSSTQDSVESLIKMGNTERALQLINILAAETNRISEDAEGLDEFKVQFKLMAVKDLEKIAMESQDTLIQVAATINNLQRSNKEEVDRVFANPATQLCKNIAEKQLSNIINAPDPNVMDVNTATLSRDIFECADTNMKPNLKDLTPNDIIINITTPTSVVTLPVISEDYANYDDADLGYALKLKDYQEITANSIEAFILMGLAIAYTMVPGEPMKSIKDYNNVIEVATDEAQKFTKIFFGQFLSYVIGSPSLAQWKGQIVDVIVISFPRNPYWWNPETRNLSGNVLNINFLMGNQRMKKLAKPMQLFFDVNKTVSPSINGSVTVPKDLGKWTPEYLDYNMTVHRVDVKRGVALIIRFVGLNQDDKVQVAVTHGRRPYAEDFNNFTILSQKKPRIISSFPKKMLKYGDLWFYVAVLPDKSMLEKSSTADNFTFNYSVSFTAASCVFWNTVEKAWLSTGCWTGRKTTESRLHCLCFHRSSFSGGYQDAPNKVERILNVPFTLAMQTNYVIFICVCFIFAVYCMLVVFGIKTVKNSKRKVMFLCDNVQSERYAYLVIVKTGSKYSAGTTSNVGLKIFGDKCDSRAHIINYPDPNMNLLQKNNEDWFILTTGKHLGTIKYIYLWHDSIGLRPSWYCEWIFIMDLQSNEEWWFDVQTWFSVLERELCKLIINASREKPVNSWKHKHFRRFLIHVKKQHIWNIYGYSEENGLSYFIRLTIVLSIILTTYSLALVLYGTPGMRLYDGLGYGHLHMYPLTVFAAFISSLISFFLHLLYISLFRKLLRVQQQRLNLPDHKHFEHNLRLPWILLISTIIACLTFLLIFGFWVAYVTSLLWVCSTVGALVQTILLLENLCIFFRVAVLAEEEKEITPDRSKIVKEIEHQRSRIFSVFGKAALMPVFMIKYRPLTREEWKVKKEQELTRQGIGELVQDLIMFVIYVILLYQVVLANKDSLDVYSHNEMKELVYGEHTRTTSFEDIQNINEFYDYINETFIPNVHSITWYGTWNMMEPGLMADFNTKILGVSRFRQQRVCKHCCDVVDVLRDLNVTCVPEFSSGHNDVGEYMEYWKEKKFVAVPRLINCWKYEDKAMPSLGEIATYFGGGYSAPLGRTMYNSYYNLAYYKNTKWIDERTRVVFVEFLAYNANYNIFHAVKLIVEQSASSLFIKSHTIYTTRLLFVKLELQRMLAVAFLVFIVTILLMVFRNINSARKHWRTYLKDTWNIIDIVICLMSFTCIGMFMYRSHLVGKFLQQLEDSKHNQFISYFNLIYMEEVFTVLASLLICVATIRLWKLLRFGVIFRIMERTLLLSAQCLLAVAVCHLIILLMFSFFGYILFGAHSSNFRNMTVTLTSLVLLSLNLHPQFDYQLLIETHGKIGYAFYTGYMLITMTIFTLYVAVITISYTEGGSYYSEVKEYYNMQRYVHDEAKYFKELLQRNVHKPRLAGGTDEIATHKKVTPKGDEHRYADAQFIPTYKLYVMSLVAKCVLYNSSKKDRSKSLLKYGFKLMKTTAFHLLKNQDIPEPKFVAFVANSEDDRIKLVSDNRILKMEHVVHCILNEGTAHNAKVESIEEPGNVALITSKCEMRLKHFENVLKLFLKIVDNIKISEEYA